MFHLGDLLGAAVAAPWEPPDGAPPEHALLARYRRQVLATEPDSAPVLRLPNDPDLEPLAQAVLQASEPPKNAAMLAGACIEMPALAFASCEQPDGSRRWHRLALLKDLSLVAVLRVRATPRGRNRANLHSASLEICDLTDTMALRLLIEDVYRDAQSPARYVRDRGRTTAPRAVWIGTPRDHRDDDFDRRVSAIAAVAGYRLRVVYGLASRTRPALQEIAGEAPELVLVWEKHLPPRNLVDRVRSLVPAASIETVDAASLDDALDEARILCDLIPVVGRASTTVAGPRTMRVAASTANDQVEHLDIVDQALHRARESPYESPADVLAALLILDAVAGEYASGTIDYADIEQVCRDRGLNYAPRVSPKALARHGARYAVDVDGVAVTMGPHLLFGGSWEPRYCARVYLYIDTLQRRIIVGHIGKHLPGASD
jgi:hypothetical protein